MSAPTPIDPRLADVLGEGGTVDVAAFGYTFTLRVDLGWYEEEREQNAALRMYLATEAVQAGAVRSQSELSYKIDGAARDLAKLENRLVNWSLPVPCAGENIRKLKAPVKAMLMAEIAKLEAGEVREVPALGEGSTTSSTP